MKYQIIEAVHGKTVRECNTLSNAAEAINSMGILYECENPEARAVVELLKVTLYKHKNDYMPEVVYKIEEN